MQYSYNQSIYLKEVCEAECDPVGYHVDKEGGGHHYPTPATVWGLQGVRRGGRSDGGAGFGVCTVAVPGSGVFPVFRR